MSEKIFLSVVIPAYNEAENFKNGVLFEVEKFLKRQKYNWEVILVDDGSLDETVFLLKDFVKARKNWRLIEAPHQGKASAVVRGILSARGENILFTDFDQATPLAEVVKLLKKANEGYEIVIGSREVKGAKRQKEPFYRHLMGKVFNLLVRLLVIKGIYDTQCGFKLFTHKAINKILPKIKVYKDIKVADAYTGAFDVELLFLAKKYHLKVIEVPIFWHHVKTTRVNPLKDSLRMFFDILKIRFYDFTGKYER